MSILTTKSEDYFDHIEDIDWDRLQKLARDFFVEEMENMRLDLERTNNARVGSRVASIKQTYSVRLSRLQSVLARMIQENGDPGIIRMRTRQIENTKSDLDQKVKDLEERRSVNVGGELKVMGIISFESDEK